MRGLKALGIDLGTRLTPANQAWNAKDFGEDTDIVYKVNRSVLAALDYSWQSATLIERQYQHSTVLSELKIMATNLLTQRIANSEHWGFKDPRTALILPFWKDVFQHLRLNDRYVIALRNPLASAYSYQKVSGVDLEEGLLLWLMHLIPAIDGTDGKKRVMVSYDLMLQDPRKQLERIREKLAIPLPLDANEVDVYANEFIDKNLHHHEYSYDDLKTHAATMVAPMCLRVYSVLMKLAKDEIEFDTTEFNTEWQQIKAEFADIHPIYCYIDSLLKRNKTLVRENRIIRKSLPWKLIYPLRIVDDVLRALRRKLRKKRKFTKLRHCEPALFAGVAIQASKTVTDERTL